MSRIVTIPRAELRRRKRALEAEMKAIEAARDVHDVADELSAVEFLLGDLDAAEVKDLPNVGDMVRVTFVAPVVHIGDAGRERLWVEIHGAWFSPEEYEAVEEN